MLKIFVFRRSWILYQEEGMPMSSLLMGKVLTQLCRVLPTYR